MQDIVVLNYGKSLVAAVRQDGPVPVYGSNGITGWHDRALGTGPTVILGRKGMGHLGVEWCSGDFWVIDTAYYTTFNLNLIEPRFFFYFTNYVGLDHLKDGTSNPSLTRERFGQQYVPLPPLPEQRTIAHILGTLDDKIELNRQMNQTLEGIARALFQSWFVDFDPVWAKVEGHPSGLAPEIEALFPNRFVDTEIGPVPEGWRVMPLSDTCDSIFSGGTPSTRDPEYWNDGVPWLSSGETRESFITETEKSISHLGVDNSSTRFARSGATVIASAGQGKTRGQTSMLLISTYINQSVIALTAQQDLISDTYLFLDLSRRYNEFRQISDSHSSRGSLTTKVISTLSMIVPSPAILRVFDQSAMSIIAVIKNNIEQARTLTDLRDTLLPKLISGELSVSNVIEMMPTETPF